MLSGAAGAIVSPCALQPEMLDQRLLAFAAILLASVPTTPWPSLGALGPAQPWSFAVQCAVIAHPCSWLTGVGFGEG